MFFQTNIFRFARTCFQRNQKYEKKNNKQRGFTQKIKKMRGLSAVIATLVRTLHRLSVPRAFPENRLVSWLYPRKNSEQWSVSYTTSGDLSVRAFQILKFVHFRLYAVDKVIFGGSGAAGFYGIRDDLQKGLELLDDVGDFPSANPATEAPVDKLRLHFACARDCTTDLKTFSSQ